MRTDLRSETRCAPRVLPLVVSTLAHRCTRVTLATPASAAPVPRPPGWHPDTLVPLRRWGWCMPREGAGPDFIESLARGLEVIAAFEAGVPAMSLAEVAAATGLARPTARRILLTLEELGHVRSTERGFELTPRVLELGTAYVRSLGLWDLARPHMENLVAKTRESCSIAQLDGPYIVYGARVAVPKIVVLRVEIGTRFPAMATSLGKVQLAALPDEEREEVLAQPTRSGLVARWQPDRRERDAALAEVRERLGADRRAARARHPLGRRAAARRLGTSGRRPQRQRARGGDLGRDAAVAVPAAAAGHRASDQRGLRAGPASAARDRRRARALIRNSGHSRGKRRCPPLTAPLARPKNRGGGRLSAIRTGGGRWPGTNRPTTPTHIPAPR